ncbi:hypothetical protein LA303_01490 [Candidatus Sulfidibacterium hydrothermale]|uniref:hypothetical protein n=1 Tax=Candidatus Sulfidibacterium hydrothermale TaxID=2875962 RepID=UPI001F0A91D6|nr:hypothetical protein [Candidatus Sulfidibacterium hydrothermale]UBM62665.1 hypothetical protein LA303_01490 [Candidatus Sulfidibacterium hydrothermale]
MKRFSKISYAFFFMFLGGVFFLSACQNHRRTTAEKAAGPVAKQPVFISGQVYDTVKCEAHPDESYALYLPKKYTPSRSFPVLFLFDAQARGILPVRRYRPLADHFGWILVCSNNSKNGLSAPVRNQYIYHFMDDVEKRFSLDSRRIYTGGFSGGARIAAGIGLSNPGIAGTIGCAAGFPPLNKIVNKQLTYIGVVGNTDFNYREMKRLSNELEAAGWRHALLIFSGHHQWPPLPVMKQAFYLLDADAMQKGSLAKNPSEINTIKRRYDSIRQQALQKKDYLLLKRTDRQLIEFLGKLTDVSAYQKEIRQITENPVFQQQKEQQALLKKEEKKWQEIYTRALENRNSEWWKTSLHQLSMMKKKAETPAQQQMVQRLYNYLSLMSYLYAYGSLKNENTPAAAKYLMIYQFVDPNNPEVYYLQARLYAKTGQQSKILPALKKAADKGFYDFKRLRTDVNFSSFHQNKTFLNILKEVKNNPMKEM